MILYVLGLNVYISHFVVLFLGFEDEKKMVATFFPYKG